MQRVKTNTIYAFIAGLVLAWNVAIGLAAFAGPNVFMPLIVNGQAPQQATITTLVESDTTFVSAVLHASSNRRFVSYIARANGNRLHITEDCGNRLEELKLPAAILGSLDLAPAFTFEGDKQADSAMIITGNTIRVFVSSRDATPEGNSDGPFKMKRIDIPLPPVLCI